MKSITSKNERRLPQGIDWRDYTTEHWSDAHQHSSFHRAEIERSDTCGCFYCVKTFTPKQIDMWWDSPEDTAYFLDNALRALGQTATCPYCGIDSVIGSASGYPITQAFLSRMGDIFFGG